jgi:hypothetical protein
MNEPVDKHKNVIQGSFPGGIPHQSVIKLMSLGKENDIVQRKGALNGINQLPIQKTSFTNAYSIEPNRINLHNSGIPIQSNVRQKMESIFDSDFSNVKIHTGGYQAESIGALAFTTGNDIYFAQGQYNPNSSYGHKLLGHELTHVVQQRNGRVRNPFGNGISVVNDYGLEAEAERMGIKASTIQAKLNISTIIQLGKSLEYSENKATWNTFVSKGLEAFTDVHNKKSTEDKCAVAIHSGGSQGTTAIAVGTDGKIYVGRTGGYQWTDFDVRSETVRKIREYYTINALNIVFCPNNEPCMHAEMAIASYLNGNINNFDFGASQGCCPLCMAYLSKYGANFGLGRSSTPLTGWQHPTKGWFLTPP